MRYDSTPHKRVMLRGDLDIDVRIHQDRGDRTALCAIGTQLPEPRGSRSPSMSGSPE